jgi:hypothetical protein
LTTFALLALLLETSRPRSADFAIVLVIKTIYSGEPAEVGKIITYEDVWHAV